MDAAPSRTAAPAPVGPGNLVLVWRPLSVRGRAENRLPRFRGPCEGVRQLRPVTFPLRDWDITSSHRNCLFTSHRAHEALCWPGKLRLHTTCSVAFAIREGEKCYRAKIKKKTEDNER